MEWKKQKDEIDFLSTYKKLIKIAKLVHEKKKWLKLYLQYIKCG